jgi:hypothetical protein
VNRLLIMLVALTVFTAVSRSAGAQDGNGVATQTAVVHEIQVTLSGHPKTGQWWSGQNRPTGRGRGLSCSTLQPAVEASPFSYANCEDHI